jgi:hypothetical protein
MEEDGLSIASIRIRLIFSHDILVENISTWVSITI